MRILPPGTLNLLLPALAMLLAPGLAQAQSDCNPAPPGSTQVVDVGSIKTVLGPLAPFDPCHKSVKLDLPGPFAKKRGDKPPVVIIAHGGGGVGGYERDFARLLNQNGYATLLYDAFEMNGLTAQSDLVVNQMTNGGRQRMIYRATLGAYRWVQGREQVDGRRIFFQGLSNGASVVLNMAAATDPARVRAVVAEGGPAAGIGFPNEVKVPVLMLYGAADTYGGRQPDDLMHARGGACTQNDFYVVAPKGFAETCNRNSAPESRMPSPQDWAGSQRAAGAPVRFELVPEAGHGMMFADFRAWTLPRGAGVQEYRTQGARSDTRRRVQEMVLAFLESHL